MSSDIVSKDGLGDRMKAYERETRTYLPARTFSVIRLDGASFSRWTRGLERPYSTRMLDAMGESMLGLCEQIPGVVCAYTQSDELTVVMQDFANQDTQPWYGGAVQKITSVSASMMTALFARHFQDRPPAMFDARVFTVPNRVEAANALMWRGLDCRRNAISMLASQHFSAKQLHGVPTDERRQMLIDAGVALDAADPRFMLGQFARQVTVLRTSYKDRRTGETVMLAEPAVSKKWVVEPAPVLDAQPDGVLLSEILPADPE